ncbi:MAG: DUF4381 domain-containing protein [gamma proteobacterium symbiont of Bathyaustriella thionipta]|nr:DUF4381 domain-containing protein [gamma proteobacterium symbiont of Bathyaustriella thionipta]MCU7948874.1 DUF4381 domain-containing protein [gamma proteobacterium symbiont of Bathyaustriella thionipta]MCU7952376.1 DUF4381 domain-containing protein [gamma proteobacterium symbiont of Bathyaustriella thionipta]MCU7955331.1 DUF4381 domain-containing protein [gamma proteobacterium symbiont of Bathyaustriella thionipta]MCU7966121.1 DUF4381 domain-containing protein [gamma proteobacterium symbion
MPAPQLPQHQTFQAPTHSTAPMPSDAVQFDPNKLADIQLPEAITLWPLAPGWWWLLGLFILISLVIIYFIKRKPPIKTATVKQFKSQAMKEFHAIKKHYEAQLNDKEATHETVKNLSIFLRRYALSLYTREQVASLTDQQWLKLLDKTYNSQFKKNADSNENNPLFSEKYAHLLTHAPYQPASQIIDHVLLSELFDSSEKLINKTAKLFTHKLSLQKQARQASASREKSDV